VRLRSISFLASLVIGTVAAAAGAGPARAEPPVLAAVAPGAAKPSPGAALGASDCAAPAAIAGLKGSLPRTAATLRAGGELRIVAIGSSSTEGYGASDKSRTYPAQLERELARRFAGTAVRVVNKGVGGELARDMVARLQRDAIASAPTLVIWQTGTNDANRGIAQADLRDTLREGIAMLQAAEIDVLVIDPQYTPRVEARGGGVFAALFDRVPDELGAAVFHRQAVMRHWVASGQFDFATMLDQDRFHMNDRSYRCLASVLGAAIERAARP